MVLYKNGKHHSISYKENKYAYKFYAFVIKTDIRNMSDSREFSWENYATLSQEAHFAIFSQKMMFLNGNENWSSIFCYRGKKV